MPQSPQLNLEIRLSNATKAVERAMRRVTDILAGQVPGQMTIFDILDDDSK